MDVKTILAVAGVGALLLFLSAKALSAPLRLALRAGLNTMIGFGALLLVNATQSFTGLSLGVNFFNAIVVGILGVPGLGLLLLVQWVLT